MMVMSLGVLCKIYLLTEIYHLALQYPAALWRILASFTIFFLNTVASLISFRQTDVFNKNMSCWITEETF